MQTQTNSLYKSEKLYGEKSRAQEYYKVRALAQIRRDVVYNLPDMTWMNDLLEDGIRYSLIFEDTEVEKLGEPVPYWEISKCFGAASLHKRFMFGQSNSKRFIFYTSREIYAEKTPQAKAIFEEKNKDLYDFLKKWGVVNISCDAFTNEETIEIQDSEFFIATSMITSSLCLNPEKFKAQGDYLKNPLPSLEQWREDCENFKAYMTSLTEKESRKAYKNAFNF